MPRVVGAQRRAAVLAAVAALALLSSACSGGDSSADPSLPATDTAAPGGDSTTSTSAAPSTTATTLSPEDSIFDQKVELSEKFMEPVRAWRQSWVTCLANTAGCDYDSLIGPYVSGPVEDGLRQTIDDLRSNKQNIRDSDPQGVNFVQYQVTREAPLQVALEVCVVVDGVTVTTAADGSEQIVDDTKPHAQLTGLVLEEQTDGTLTIDQSREYTEAQNIKADNCDQYDELPASQ